MMWWNGDWSGWGWLGMLAMMAMMVVFWGLVIWGIVLLVRYLNQARPAQMEHGEHRSTPQEILAERFARGEMDATEYGQRLTVLQSPPAMKAPPAAESSPSAERELVPK